MVRGFYNLIAVLRGKDNGQQRTYGPVTQDTRREPPIESERPEAKAGDLNVARRF